MCAGGKGMGGNSMCPHICPGENPICQTALESNQGWSWRRWTVMKASSIKFLIELLNNALLSKEYLCFEMIQESHVCTEMDLRLS